MPANHDTVVAELDVQFRCAGSESFVSWIDNTLGIDRTANVMPMAVEEAMREKLE